MNINIIDVLKELDRIAQQANSLWHQCESLKMSIASKEFHRPAEELKKLGIFNPEGKK